MIDLAKEEVAPLGTATRWLPGRRQGKKPHVSTLWRWATAGCKGILLETLRVGETLCTSREALQRFCDALTAQGQGATPAPPSPRLSAARRKQIDHAKRELAEAGI